MGNRVVHFEIEAQNLERAKKFYTDAFGWKMDQMGGDYGNYVVAVTGDPKEPGGINGGLYESKEKVTNAYRCVIGVDDIKKAVADVKASGGTIDNEEPTDIKGVGLFVSCKDTEGNAFSILQPSPDMAPKS